MSTTTAGLRNLCYADQLFADRYEHWQEVGDGGYATVVKVRGRHDGATLALKLFRHLPEGYQPRLQREVNAARELSSPYIVKTYSLFAQGSLCWFEMEHVDGPNLRNELARRQQAGEPFQYLEALDIAIAVASAIVEAHRIDLIHRDVKPDNILLPASKNPPAKLTDFGIARMRGVINLTKTDQMMGTPMYASPEAGRGEPVTKAHDIYSLALCLFQLFTQNRFPYPIDPDAGGLAMLKVHQDKHPAPLRSLSPDLPEDLEDLLSRGLSKTPSNRPTAEQMLAALQELRTRALNPTAAPPRHALSRRQIALAAGAGTVLLLAGVLFLRPRPDETAAARPSPLATLDPSAPTLAPRLVAPASPPVATNPPAPTRPPVLEAKLRGRSLRLVVPGKDPIAPSQLVLIGRSGNEHLLTLTDTLEPQQGVYYPLDDFQPPVPDTELPPREIRVTVRGTAGSQSLSIPF